MDIGLSLIYAVITTKVFNIDLTSTIILLSIAFGLLPDIDMSVEIFKKGAFHGNGDKFHRTITHFPILYLPIIPFIFYRYGNFWGTLFTVNLFSHFIHDVIGTGWGLKLLWPFSKKNFKMFSDPINGKLSTNFIVSWNPRELKISVERYGDKHWFKNLYLNFSNVFLLELLFLVIGIAVVLIAL